MLDGGNPVICMFSIFQKDRFLIIAIIFMSMCVSFAMSVSMVFIKPMSQLNQSLEGTKMIGNIQLTNSLCPSCLRTNHLQNLLLPNNKEDKLHTSCGRR